ncbi:MAG: hypothetical protein SGPRY_013748 [Prymnesium sp.]
MPRVLTANSIQQALSLPEDAEWKQIRRRHRRIFHLLAQEKCNLDHSSEAREWLSVLMQRDQRERTSPSRASADHGNDFDDVDEEGGWSDGELEDTDDAGDKTMGDSSSVAATSEYIYTGVPSPPKELKSKPSFIPLQETLHSEQPSTRLEESRCPVPEASAGWPENPLSAQESMVASHEEEMEVEARTPAAEIAAETIMERRGAAEQVTCYMASEPASCYTSKEPAACYTSIEPTHCYTSAEHTPCYTATEQAAAYISGEPATCFTSAAQDDCFTPADLTPCYTAAEQQAACYTAADQAASHGGAANAAAERGTQYAPRFASNHEAMEPCASASQSAVSAALAAVEAAEAASRAATEHVGKQQKSATAIIEAKLAVEQAVAAQERFRHQLAPPGQEEAMTQHRDTWMQANTSPDPHQPFAFPSRGNA